MEQRVSQIGEKIKAPNEQMLTVVDAIRKAMRNNRQITFQYYMYDARRERAEWRVAKHAGKEYRVSPYATIWNNERYYLIGYSERHGGLATFRIDRLGLPEMTAWNRKPAPENFRIQDYTEKVFSMYQGPEKKVTLQCVNGILDQVIDKFGEEIMIRRIRENVFEVTVSVNVSTTFFSWVFAFPGEMTITGPETVIKQYTDYLEIVLDDVLSEGLKANG